MEEHSDKQWMWEFCLKQQQKEVCEVFQNLRSNLIIPLPLPCLAWSELKNFLPI